MSETQAIEARLQRLRTKLLDLTTTNRMLSYRHPRASCLRVVDELPAQLFESLMAGETLVFEPVAEPTQRELDAFHSGDPSRVPRANAAVGREKPDAATWAKHTGIRIAYDLEVESDDFEREDRHRDKKVQTLDYPDALDARLRKIRAAGRTAIEESGANMLYLAFGFLEWRDQSNSKAHQAPLILLPVELQREPKRGGYRTLIRWTGEELQANLSLEKKLEEFGIVLPKLEEEQGFEDYLTQVARATKSKVDWQVRRYVTLGLFEFGKILLYLDLDPTRWPSFAPIAEHPLVQRVLSSEGATDTETAATYDADEDFLFRDLELELVDRADSSQSEALQVALAGRNLVVQGPPGTGKSQTITNLIAAAISRGKTVLFVAEKLAALEVVRRRLRELGLGDFCLELHSHKTRKTEALEDIGERIRASARARPPRDFETAKTQLESRRLQLSNYINVVSGPAGKLSGLTVSEALMKAGRARRKLGDAIGQIEPLAAEVNGSSTTWAELADAQSRLSVLRKALSEIGPLHSPDDHPWAGVSAAVAMPNDAAKIAALAKSWAMAAEDLRAVMAGTKWDGARVEDWPAVVQALKALDSVRRHCVAAEPVALQAEQILGLPIGRGGAGARDLISILDLAASAPAGALDLRRASLLRPDLLPWAERLAERVSQLREARRTTQEAFRESAFSEDLDDVEEWSAALSQSSWLARFGKRWRDASKAWSRLARPAHLKDHPAQRSQALASLREYRLGERDFSSDADINQKLGDHAVGLETRVDDLVALASWVAASHERAPGAADMLTSLDPSSLEKLTGLSTEPLKLELEALASSLPAEGGDTFWDSAVTGLAAPNLWLPLREAVAEDEWQDALALASRAAELGADLDKASAAFKAATGLNEEIFFSKYPSASLASTAARANFAADHPLDLPSWLELDRARSASTAKLEAPLIEHALRGDMAATDLPIALDFLVFDSIARTAFRASPQLLSISGKSLDLARTEYRELDARVMELRRAQIAAELLKAQPPQGRQSGLKSELSEMSLIRAELSKQKRHIPIRQLVLRAGKALQALKPCFMMGPLSVAQYVAPGKLKFDLVIMDEASQMRPEDAIGALARGKQAVVVGDAKQLPPTSFFDRIAEGREDDGDDEDLTLAEDTKSILELAESIFDQRMLKWHYRSRHEALIAFSNKHFYKNDLIVFPSPSGQNGRLGIGWTFVANGSAQKGVNPMEARVVAEGARQFLLNHPGRSLGVVAMNVKQAQRIADEIAALASSDPSFQAALAQAESDSAEPFFVKNLENVQGDERDVIMISMTYGPVEPGGKTPQNFGPINQATGWRRLNVLFTRAKERMEIFSTMRSTDVLPKEGGDLGPRALKVFLDYAESGRLSVEPTDTRRPTDSDFEDAVLEGLREFGFDCVPQLGVANFFLDIAVRDPNSPHEFIAAVECDGAAYHSSRSARDRDRLRQEILESLGWSVLRLWSTDWFRDPQKELQRIISDLNALIEQSARRRERERDAALVPATPPLILSPQEPQSEAARPVAKAGASGSPPKATKRGISIEQARARLIDLREGKIKQDRPDADPTRGFLRKSMLDELLRKLPTDHAEFLELIPHSLREQTDGEQVVKYREEVFDILALVDA